MYYCHIIEGHIFSNSETNTIFWYTKSHFPYQMNIQRLAYLSQLVSSEMIELNLIASSFCCK